MQHSCNVGATKLQQRCNRDAKAGATAGAAKVQQRCNRDITEVQQLVQQYMSSYTIIHLVKMVKIQNGQKDQTRHYLFYLWKFELTYVTYITHDLLMIYLWTSISCFSQSNL